MPPKRKRKEVEKAPETPSDNVRTLIEQLTSHGAQELPTTESAALKKSCRMLGDAFAVEVAAIVLNRLEAEHAQIRYASILVADLLFARWRAFRVAWLTHIRQSLELACGDHGRAHLMPRPPKWAEMTRRLALTKLREWTVAFGGRHRELHLACDFLRTAWRVDVDNIDGETGEQRERREREASAEQERFRIKFQQVCDEAKEALPEMRAVVMELSSCLDLLVMPPGGGVEEEEDEAREGKAHEEQGELAHRLGLGTASFRLDIKVGGTGEASSIRVEETLDNSAVIETAKANVTLVQKTLRRRLTTLVDGIGRWATERDGEARDRLLRECMDCRGAMDRALRLFGSLKIVQNLAVRNMRDGKRTRGNEEVSDADEEDDEDEDDEVDMDAMEDVEDVDGDEEKEKAEGVRQREGRTTLCTTTTTTQPRASVPTECATDTTNATTAEVEDMDSRDPERIRQKLMETAPVVSYGIDLELWGVDTIPEYLRRTDSNSFHRFWGTGEHDNGLLAEEKVEERVRKRVTLYRPVAKPVEECGVMLVNGKRCGKVKGKCRIHATKKPEGEAESEQKKKQKKRRRRSGEEEGTASALEDVTKNAAESLEERLGAVVSPRRLKKGAQAAFSREMAAIEQRNRAKFGHQWHYQ